VLRFPVRVSLKCPIQKSSAVNVSYQTESSTFRQHLFSSVFCCRAGSGYPSTVSPHHPFCSCLLECCIVTVHGQIMKHLQSPSTSSPFTQQSSFKNPFNNIMLQYLCDICSNLYLLCYQWSLLILQFQLKKPPNWYFMCATDLK